MNGNFTKQNRGELRQSFPIYVISGIIQFITTHKWLLLAQFAITVLLISGVVSGADWFVGKLLFGDMDAVEAVFMKEFSRYLYKPMIGFVIMITAVLWYLYLIFLEPVILRASIKDEKRFFEVAYRLEHRIGMHIVYLVMIIAVLNNTNQSVRSTGDNRDLAGYLGDYRNYCAGELSVEQGVFCVTDEPYNIDSDAKTQPVSGIVYLNFNGEDDSSRKCLRCPEALYRKCDLADSYTFRVTYMPYSLVVADIVPIKITREDREEAAAVWGFDGLSTHEQEVLALMLSEKLAQVWLTKQDKDAVYPVYFEDKMEREEFQELKKYYLSATFEYPIRPYKYDVYGGTDNNVIVTGENISFSVTGTDNWFTVEIEEYYEAYKKFFTEFAADMPEFSDDREKIVYCVQYLIDKAKPLDHREILALEDGNLIYFCSSGYGPLLLGYGNSQAYSQALTGLFKAAGIEALPVSMENTAGSYYRNLVKLEGEWYYIDAYRADILSNADSILFRDEDFSRIYGVGRDVFVLRYGYTELEVPATGTEQIKADISFDRKKEQSPEKINEYREVLADIENGAEINLFGEGDLEKEDETEHIRSWVEQTFLHVQTIDPESEEHLEFEYGKTANSLAEDLFRYLAINFTPVIYCGSDGEEASLASNTVYEERLEGLSDLIVGFQASKTVIKGSHVKETYEALTGLNADGLLDFTRYETPDKTAVYEYNKHWDVLTKTYETEFKDRSGNEHEGNIARYLYTYPAEAKVENIMETENGYEVVFYTNYTGYGEHYFTMQIEKQADASLQLRSIKKRYYN